MINAQTHRVTQYILAAGLVLLLMAVPSQIILGVALPQGRLFIITGILSLLLALPLLMGLSVSPAVTLTDEGLTLHPTIWRERFVRWDEVRAVKEYPLLPTEEMELNRRAFVGKKRYHAPQGIMLMIPSLPFQYRAAGWFAGEGFTGIIALTNRTHADYDALVRQIENKVMG